ncbi:MAG: hypothetical protein M1839_000456 [Geoglossum umbratile]|nr:MAG: hypothetical protein M1839_000456 [Geoglossum umbratile]
MTETGGRIRKGWDEVLKGERYYFHVPKVPGIKEEGKEFCMCQRALIWVYARNAVPPTPPNEYPIVPSFQEWVFPHGNLPPTWTVPSSDDIPTTSPSDMASAVLARDPSCQISSHRDCKSCAHICPAAQATWFTTNGIQSYNLRCQSSFIYIVDDIRNGLTLRLDLHHDFDKKKFVFVPKMGMLVTHMLQPTYELGRLYHNTLLLETPGISIEFLLARFAWAIFLSVKHFLLAGLLRLLQCVLLQQDVGPKHTIVKANAKTCQELGGAKTPSPTKRKAPTGDVVDDIESDVEEMHSHKRVRTSPFSNQGSDTDSSRSPPDRRGAELCECGVTTLLHFTYEHKAVAEKLHRQTDADLVDEMDCDALRLSIEEDI